MAPPLPQSTSFGWGLRMFVVAWGEAGRMWLSGDPGETGPMHPPPYGLVGETHAVMGGCQHAMKGPIIPFMKAWTPPRAPFGF